MGAYTLRLTRFRKLRPDVGVKIKEVASREEKHGARLRVASVEPKINLRLMSSAASSIPRYSLPYVIWKEYIIYINDI